MDTEDIYNKVKEDASYVVTEKSKAMYPPAMYNGHHIYRLQHVSKQSDTHLRQP